jgi:hypothetical protein
VDDHTGPASLAILICTGENKVHNQLQAHTKGSCGVPENNIQFLELTLLLFLKPQQSL